MFKVKDFILFFFWMFPVTFSFFPIGTGKIAALYFLSYIFLVMRREFRIKYILSSFCLLLFIIYISFITTLNGVNDFSLPYLLLLHIVEFSPGAIYFCHRYKQGILNDEVLSLYLMFVGLILSFSVFILLSSLEIRLISLNYIPQYGNIDALRLTRIRGLSNGGGSDHSIQLALCIIGCVYLFMTSKNVIIKNLSLIVILLIMSSIVFVARTGFIVAIGIVLGSLFIFKRVFFYRITSIIIILYLLALLSPFIINLIDDYTEGYFTKLTLPWFLDTFSILTNGEVNSSNSELLKMIFLPNGFVSLMFGEGSYTDFGYYRYSDSGFVKFIFSFGLPLTFFMVLAILIPIYISYRRGNHFDKLLAVALTLILLLTIKEPFILKIGTAHLLYFTIYRFWLYPKRFDNENWLRSS